MRFKRRSPCLILATFLAALFLCAGYSYALDLSIEPAKTQRAVNEQFRVNIYATGAVNLISFGIKLTFDPAVVDQGVQNALPCLRAG